jgi:hypothetical protein
VKTRRPDKNVRVFFMDEARFGQQGTLTRKWAPTGSRPTAVKQTKYEWLYLYGAVDPATGDSSALLARHVNTETMDAFLGVLSSEVGAGDHVVLVMDGAGWHVSKTLKVPVNITLLILPPYSPELNPVERLWLYIKSHYTSNRVFADYDDLVKVTGDGYRALTPDLLKSICACSWITPGCQG